MNFSTDREKRIRQLRNLEEQNDLASRVRDFMDWLEDRTQPVGMPIPRIEIREAFEDALFNADARRHHYLIVKGPKDCHYNDPMASLDRPTPCDCGVCNEDKYEVIHDPDCGFVEDYGHGFSVPGGVPFQSYKQYTCAVQYQIDNIGYEDFQDLDLKPGKYEIRYVFNWSGSMFDDSEQYIEVISDKLPEDTL